MTDAASAPVRLSAEFLHDPAARRVAAALQEGGARCWFVGGCVRNALLGDGASDLDMCTDAAPRRTLALLAEAGLRAVPTGIDHGTVTAVHDGEPVEITTLRADVATDGRRAVVAFTDDIAQDAARRDFTMNALYATPDGLLVDPLGGLPDRRARRVRFIGDADARIREDYLRILRFFRFHARHGDPEGGIDPEGLAACAAGLDGIDTLSRERIGAEMRKLLAAADPAPALAAMAACGALARVAPGAEAAGIAPLVHAEAARGGAAAWTRRAAALTAPSWAFLPGGAEGAGAGLGLRWRLSKAETRALDRIRAAVEGGEAPAVAAQLHGAEAAFDAALLREAAGAAQAPDLEARIAFGAAARFPVSAKTLIGRGATPGPGLGRRLDRMRARWLASGMTLGAEDLIAAEPEGDGDAPQRRGRGEA